MWRGGKEQPAGVAAPPAAVATLLVRSSPFRAPALSPSAPGSARQRQATTQAEAAPYVVRDRIPQRQRLDFLQSTHQQADQAAVPRLRVDALDRARPLLVDLLGLVG